MASECDVEAEIEVLQSIYVDELRVERTDDGCWDVRLVLHPSTAQDSVSQFVRLTLRLALDREYPLSTPAISVHNPRGLSDDKINSVERSLQAEAQSSVGSPVLYQLIEKAKEILTESNIPHGSCVICLYDFKEGETLTKTSCYHYFHSHCLGRYVQHSEHELQQRKKELQDDKSRDNTHTQELNVLCPVCREALNYDACQLLSCPAPLLPQEDEAAISSDFHLKWNELQKILDKQRTNGGIIDPEEESNRFLIHIQAPAASENPDADPSSDLAPPPLLEPGAGTAPAPPSMHRCQSDAHDSRRHAHGTGPRRWSRARPIADRLDRLSLCGEAKHGKPPPARLKDEPHRPEAAMEAPDRGHRGRRRPPHHYHAQPRHHWEGRGGHPQSYRGGKSQRRGPQQRPLERERNREEVL